MPGAWLSTKQTAGPEWQDTRDERKEVAEVVGAGGIEPPTPRV